ncbi:hypothetical protein GGR56DRAFT_668804 [Xylariaceae sp. FL0804]|nr:hypothetical protein GGR56DRAFT_668804 [Xylariaceae sp. FL0804]
MPVLTEQEVQSLAASNPELFHPVIEAAGTSLFHGTAVRRLAVARLDASPDSTRHQLRELVDRHPSLLQEHSTPTAALCHMVADLPYELRMVIIEFLFGPSTDHLARPSPPEPDCRTDIPAYRATFVSAADHAFWRTIRALPSVGYQIRVNPFEMYSLLNLPGFELCLEDYEDSSLGSHGLRRRYYHVNGPHSDLNVWAARFAASELDPESYSWHDGDLSDEEMEIIMSERNADRIEAVKLLKELRDALRQTGERAEGQSKIVTDASDEGLAQIQVTD